MLRFIFFSMAVLAISFFAVPVYFGIEKEHQKLTQTAALETSDSALTLQEIYTLADETSTFDPAALNNITPAAGGETIQTENFSHGFSATQDSAL